MAASFHARAYDAAHAILLVAAALGIADMFSSVSRGLGIALIAVASSELLRLYSGRAASNILVIAAAVVCVIAIGVSWITTAGPPPRSAPPVVEEPITYVLPPSSAQRIQEALDPIALGAPIADGYTLANIAIEGDHIDLAVSGESSFVVRLAHRDAARGVEGNTRSFAIDVDPPLDEDDPRRRAVRNIVRAIERGDRGGFWARAERNE